RRRRHLPWRAAGPALPPPPAEPPAPRSARPGEPGRGTRLRQPGGGDQLRATRHGSSLCQRIGRLAGGKGRPAADWRLMTLRRHRSIGLYRTMFRRSERRSKLLSRSRQPRGAAHLGGKFMRRAAMKALATLGFGLALGVGALLAGTSATPAAAGQFDGVTVNIVTFTGPQIAEPLQRRAPDFQKLTGAKVHVITVRFFDLYNKLLTDFATGTNSYDAAVFAPQWMVDFIEPGYLEDLTDRIKADAALKWDDIGPFFRDFSATYNGKIYTIPLDGDF